MAVGAFKHGGADDSIALNQSDCWKRFSYMTCCKNNMAAGVKKKDENNEHILYNLFVHAEWNLDGEVLVRNLLFAGQFGCL